MTDAFPIVDLDPEVFNLCHISIVRLGVLDTTVCSLEFSILLVKPHCRQILLYQLFCRSSGYIGCVKYSVPL